MNNTFDINSLKIGFQDTWWELSKECEQCKQDFSPAFTGQKFCSDSCIDEHYLKGEE